MYETVIVGGGPAGLSAALVLGRCGRHVLLCDAGAPRNASSRELHGFLTRDGIPPIDLLRLGRLELDRYGVQQRLVEVSNIELQPEGFHITLVDGECLHSRTVLLACGVRDELPGIRGLKECFGITAHHCPYCDGWETRRKRIVVIGRGAKGAALALALKTWSDDVVLCSNGAAHLGRTHREQLARHDIAINERGIAAIEHSSGRVEHLVMATGERLPCGAIFVTTQQKQWDLPRRLGCTLTRQGTVKTDHLGQTGVAGLYVAGDASRDVQFAIVAAAEGAKAAVAINKALQERTGLALPA